MNETLAELGVTDIFSSTTANFTPLTDAIQLFVGNIEHGARFKIDEEGREAAAYTLIPSINTSQSPINK